MIMTMKKGARDIKSKAQEGQSKIENFVNEYGTKSNIFKALGILAGVGVGTFLAVKYVPWGTVGEKLQDGLEKVEEAFNKAFEEAAPSEHSPSEATV